MEHPTVGSQLATKMDEITKMFLRKIKNMEYKNVSLIPEYEATESRYRSLRESLEMANGMLKSLMTYEHGSRIYKTIKKSLEYISTKSTLNIYKNLDVYENAAKVGESIASLGDEYKSIGDKFSNAFKNASQSKKALNSRLEQIRLRLKSVRNDAAEIDKLRKKVRNMRFDLESLMQDGGYNDEIREAEVKEFRDASKSTLRSMYGFLSKSEIQQILKDVSLEYRRHLDDASNALMQVK